MVPLETAVQGVPPAVVYTGTDEEGQLTTLVGRGIHGSGIEGEIDGNQDQQWRFATNIVTSVKGQ